MEPSNLSPAAERLLDAAMELFAAQGYDRTSVGEIQEAAGLTFGSGALYKHFRSKEDVLAEGMARFVDHARRGHEVLGALDGQDMESALTTIATQSMSSFARDKSALRIAWRDLEAFPALLESVRTERIRATFDEFAAWVERQPRADDSGLDDHAALAAVALSALAFFQLLRFLLDDTPGGVSEERFVATWVGLFAGVLAPPED